MKKYIILILFASAISPLGASGEEGLTLEQAVTIALQRNLEILLAQKDLVTATAKRLQMEAISDPALVFSTEGIGLKKRSDGSNEKEISLGLEQDLEFPGKRALRGKIGMFGEERSALELERVRLLIAARVKKAYYKAVLAQRTIGALDHAASLLDQFIENLLVKYQSGAALYSDVLRARVEKARLENQIIEERKESGTARAVLNLLMGRRGDESMNLATDMTYVPMKEDLPGLKEEARASRPSLKISALKRRMFETGLGMARMSRLPDFSLGLYFPSLRAGAWGFSVGLTVPLWGKRQKGEILEAEAANDGAIILAEQEERRLMAGIESAYASVRAAEEQVKVFEQKLLKDMEDELKLGLSYYQYGKIEFFNLLDLYRTYAAARLEHLKSLYLYLVSLADLEVAGEEYAD